MHSTHLCPEYTHTALVLELYSWEACPASSTTTVTTYTAQGNPGDPPALARGHAELGSSPAPGQERCKRGFHNSRGLPWPAASQADQESQRIAGGVLFVFLILLQSRKKGYLVSHNVITGFLWFPEPVTAAGRTPPIQHSRPSQETQVLLPKTLMYRVPFHNRESTRDLGRRSSNVRCLNVINKSAGSPGGALLPYGAPASRPSAACWGARGLLAGAWAFRPATPNLSEKKFAFFLFVFFNKVCNQNKMSAVLQFSPHHAFS